MSQEIKIQHDVTLYRLLEDGVIVPDYQRDYAQGRTGDPKIEETRRNFVTDIIDAARPDGNRKIHTGLVYGSVNKELEEYVAVDGQQRLTTMFLFHLYLAKKLGLSHDSEIIRRLKRFGWHGRTYASEFTDFLFNVDWPADGAGLVDSLESSNQFYKIWKRDPSVCCMLTMLAEIDRQVSGRKYELMLDSLISDGSRLVFDYMRLDEGTDEFQYQKMNSRGRDLTTFELFKQKLQDEEKGLSEEFKRKMDNEWLEFFDRLATEKNLESDVFYQNLINEIALIRGVKAQGEDFAYIGQIDESKKLKDNDVGFVSFDAYFDLRTNINDFERYLDWLCDNLESIEAVIEKFAYCGEDARFADIFVRKNYTVRTFCYAVMHYAEKSEYARLDKEAFGLWWRPVHNLIANTSIDSDNFKDIMLSIDALPIANLEDHLSKNEIKAFIEQREEEKFKAKHPDLRDKFIEQERRRRFKGHISLLLPFENEKLLFQWNTIVDCFNSLIEGWKDSPTTTDFNFIQALLSMLPAEKTADFIGKRSLFYHYGYLRKGVISQMVHTLLFKFVEFRLNSPASSLSDFFAKCQTDWLKKYEEMTYHERRDSYWMKYIYDHSERCAKAFHKSSCGQFTPKWGCGWTLTVFLSRKKNANAEDLLISNRREQAIEKILGKEAVTPYGWDVLRHLEKPYDYITVCFVRDTIWIGISKAAAVDIDPIPEGSGIGSDHNYKAWIWMPWDKVNVFYEHENETEEEYLDALYQSFQGTLETFIKCLNPRPRAEISSKE